MEKIQPRGITQKGAQVDKNLLSVIFGEDLINKELSFKDEEKVSVFEKGLKSSINTADTIEMAIEKIVKTALACEFGPSFVLQKGTEKMIKTISHGIVSDSQLRKQALIIMDKFANSKTSRYIKLPSTKKVN